VTTAVTPAASPAPAVRAATSENSSPATIRDARRNVAGDLAKSKTRIDELIASLKAEVRTFAELTAIAQVAGITDVTLPSTADVVDAAVGSER
jgi:hypothetical protein